MKAQLLCRLRGGRTQTFNVRGEESVIGRDPGIAVSVALEGISRRHARIRFDGKAYWIEDLTSTNGTFLNGKPVRKERLRHLDVITLGRKADLLFVLRGEEQQVVKRQGIVRAALVPVDSPDAMPHEVPVGETTLGRSSVCNVRVESTTASKMHAHVRRSVDQLVVQDLGSSNGTFVNGQRVTITELRDGDVLSLGGVENYKVMVELGEVTTSSGQHALPIAVATPAPARPRFSNAWKTRFEWDPDELKVIVEVQQAGLAARRATTAAKPKDKPGGTRSPHPPPAAKAPPAAKPAPTKAPASPAAAGPAPGSRPPLAASASSEPKTVVPAAGVQASGATAPPSEPKTVIPTAPGPPPAAQTRPPSAAPPRPAPSPVPASAPPAPRAAPPDAPTPPDPTVSDRVPGSVEPPASASAPLARIVELRLRGAGYDLVVTESGAHSLGRAKDASLRVDHPTVSRKHARIILSDDRTVCYLQDLGGANGTLLNSVALQELKPLKEDDRIRVGEVDLTVSFRRE